MATRAKDSKPTTATKPPARRKAARTTGGKAKTAASVKAKAPSTPAAAATAAVVQDVKAVAAKVVASTERVPETVKTVAAKALPAKAPTPARRKAVATPRAAPAKRGAAGVGAGTMLGVAAAGLAAGLVANLGRKAAVQAPSVMAGDWMEALKTEHKAALALLDQLAKTTDKQVAKRTLLLTQLRHALGKHAFTEENVIYTALREWGDKADADALNHEQGYHKQYLYEMEALPKGSPEFARRIADFRIDLEAHIREEEDKIFPKLHDGLSAERNKALTALANKEGFKLA